MVSRPVMAGSAMLLALLGSSISPAAPPPNYYASIDPSSPESLASTIHDVIDDHTRFPYTSAATDTWDILELAQQDPGVATSILDVYRNASYAKQGGGNALYDREHTWPRSFGFPNDSGSNYPFTDAHLLHLADSGYNGSRGNKPYGPCDASCALRATLPNDGMGGGPDLYPGDDNWVVDSGIAGGILGRWETWTGRRGDVARSLLYADLRYEGGVHGLTGATEPDLVLTDDETLIALSNTGANESVAYMGLLSTLLAWHAEDPVDDFERHRNDVVFGFQGNRNPFVDHPEWVAALFSIDGCEASAECDDGLYCNGAEACADGLCVAGPPPCETSSLLCSESELLCVPTGPSSTIWINELHYDNAGADLGEFFEIAGPAGESLDGWSVVGYNGSTGAPYATVVLSGAIPQQVGCFGTLAFDLAGMQNGSPDALALVDAQGGVVEFISYEGAFSATAGPVSGSPSIDIGVSEPSNAPVGSSLERAGFGETATDFTWQDVGPASRGLPNAGQSFAPCAPTPVPSGHASTHGILVISAILVVATRLRVDESRVRIG